MTPPTAVSDRTVALIGNPNVGKSTLFNALTGLRQRVANYPGVTVDAREGTIASEKGPLRLVDLPGTYSLRAGSADEAVVERILVGHGVEPPDVILVALDATNLRRNLYLLTEILDLGVPVVIALNMVDDARRSGVEVPSEQLREATGCPVVETVATQGEGVDELREALGKVEYSPRRVWRFSDPAVEERLRGIEAETAWHSVKTLCADDKTLREQEVTGRYTWINETLVDGRSGSLGDVRARTDRIDRVLLHPVLGPLVFLLIMGILFQSIFAWAVPVMDLVELVFGKIGSWASAVLPPLVGPTFTGLLVDGALAGVGAVVVFLPQILLLFFFLGLLEDTGYMARAAFLADRPLRSVGLSGRAFIPLLSSFACAIPGVMATRTIPNRFERYLAILVAPLMTCSARLPVYTLLIAAFIPATTVAGFLNLQGLVLLGLYLAGLVAGALVAFLVSRAQKKRRGKLLPLVVELPMYRRPALKSVLLKLRVRGGDFLKRAGTVIFAVSVVLWVLMTYPQQDPQPGMTEKQVAQLQLEKSFAGRMGHAIEPLIQPLGYDWKMGVGLIASFAAREVFVSTMGVVYALGDEVDETSKGLRETLQQARGPDGKKSYTLATVFSLLAFYVFALQCGATVAVVKRETSSWKFAVGQLLGFLVLAYLAALVVYQVMAALGYG